MLHGRRKNILEKVADAQLEHGTGVPTMRPEFVPFPHQEAAIRKLFDNKGRLVLSHPTGSGKTNSAIYGFEKLRAAGKAKRALVVTPSGLRTNFAHDGVKKTTTSSYQIVGGNEERKIDPNVVSPLNVKSDKDYTIVGYETFVRNPVGFMQASGADTLILDEFHKARNPRTSTFQAVMAARPLAANFIGLSGSPVNNNPAELATLLTMSEGEQIISPAGFKRAFLRNVGFTTGFTGKQVPRQDFVNQQQLVRMLLPRMDYLPIEALQGKVMPRKDLQNVRVPMSKEQYDLYQLALNKLGPAKEMIMRGDPNISLKDAQQIFTQISQARQVANSVAMGRNDVSIEQSVDRTPKVKRLIDDVDSHLKTNPQHAAVLYSNLVNGGVDVLSAGLKARGIEHALFIGKGAEVAGNKVTSEQREVGLKAYKDGKVKAIILSGAGAEGLDLKNSTGFFALDGHFNPERILQAEARARRFGGQEFREPDKRVVDVRRYQSVAPEQPPMSWFARMFARKQPNYTTDEWMYNVAGQKYQKTKNLYSALEHPYKYIRKYTAANGQTRYVYPDPKTGYATISDQPQGAQ